MFEVCSFVFVSFRRLSKICRHGVDQGKGGAERLSSTENWKIEWFVSSELFGRNVKNQRIIFGFFFFCPCTRCTENRSRAAATAAAEEEKPRAAARRVLFSCARLFFPLPRALLSPPLVCHSSCLAAEKKTSSTAAVRPLALSRFNQPYFSHSISLSLSLCPPLDALQDPSSSSAARRGGRYINYSRGIFWVGGLGVRFHRRRRRHFGCFPRRRRRSEPSPPIFNARRHAAVAAAAVAPPLPLATTPARSSPAGRRSASFFFFFFHFVHSFFPFFFFVIHSHTHTHTQYPPSTWLAAAASVPGARQYYFIRWNSRNRRRSKRSSSVLLFFARARARLHSSARRVKRTSIIPAVDVVVSVFTRPATHSDNNVDRRWPVVWRFLPVSQQPQWRTTKTIRTAKPERRTTTSVAGCVVNRRWPPSDDIRSLSPPPSLPTATTTGHAQEICATSLSSICEYRWASSFTPGRCTAFFFVSLDPFLFWAGRRIVWNKRCADTRLAVIKRRRSRLSPDNDDDICRTAVTLPAATNGKKCRVFYPVCASWAKILGVISVDFCAHFVLFR